MAGRIIRQTGTTVLSDDSVRLKQDRQRTVKYTAVRKTERRFEVTVCSPKYSRMYGETAYGNTIDTAVARLRARLEFEHQYYGTLLLLGCAVITPTKEDVRPLGGYREWGKVNGPVLKG